MLKARTRSKLLMLLGLILISAPVPGHAQEPAARGWTQMQAATLKAWVRKAPQDALPLLPTNTLDAALASGDAQAIDEAASDLALRLARLHLLGRASSGERAGWHIEDSDARIDIAARLQRALTLDSLDWFMSGLAPGHPDYAALREAYAHETGASKRDALARNMERWRWLPNALGPDFVIVNAAHFDVTLWREGARVRTWPVIVGKKSTPTPVFSATITGVILNPWWEIPASIVRESVGSLVRRNPSLARARGYVWSDGRYRQKPGPGNALGQMKLVMPNRFSVFLHDTPNKTLFAKDVRAFSHGCIRVGGALDFAATLLEGARTPEQVDAVVASGRTTQVDLTRPLTLYVTYFTAVPVENGAIEYLDDIYGRDRRISKLAALGQGCKA